MKLSRLARRVLGFTLLVFGTVNPANAGTPGKCVGRIPKCTTKKVCGSNSSACNVWISEKGGVANATARNLANGHVGKPKAAICVKPGTRISWSTQEKDSEFTATFGVPHPFTRNPPVFHGTVGQTDFDTANASGCYQFKVEHSVKGQTPAKADPKVIVTDIGDM
jgi:hypothetical protein